MLIYDNYIYSKLSNITIDFIDISSTYIAIGIIQYRLGKYKQAFKYYRIPFYFLEIVQCDNCKDADKKRWTSIRDGCSKQFDCEFSSGDAIACITVFLGLSEEI
jgi:hypothetical protein